MIVGLFETEGHAEIPGRLAVPPSSLLVQGKLRHCSKEGVMRMRAAVVETKGGPRTIQGSWTATNAQRGKKILVRVVAGGGSHTAALARDQGLPFPLLGIPATGSLSASGCASMLCVADTRSAGPVPQGLTACLVCARSPPSMPLTSYARPPRRHPTGRLPDAARLRRHLAPT
jgi:hypothetical protein